MFETCKYDLKSLELTKLPEKSHEWLINTKTSLECRMTSQYEFVMT